jgi:predicted RNA polymerase sigma factor
MYIVSEVIVIVDAGRGRPKVKDAQVLRELYESGFSTVELARFFNVTPQAVWQRLLQVRARIRDKKTAQQIRRRREKLQREAMVA